MKSVQEIIAEYENLLRLAGNPLFGEDSNLYPQVLLPSLALDWIIDDDPNSKQYPPSQMAEIGLFQKLWYKKYDKEIEDANGYGLDIDATLALMQARHFSVAFGAFDDGPNHA